MPKTEEATVTTKGWVLDHIGFDVTDLQAFIKTLEAAGISTLPSTCRRRGDRLDRRDLGGVDVLDRGGAGTDGDTVDMHGAGAAERHAAAGFVPVMPSTSRNLMAPRHCP